MLNKSDLVVRLNESIFNIIVKNTSIDAFLRAIYKTIQLCEEAGNMSKTKKFYGIYGKNGIGIYREWDMVEKSRRYIFGFRVKGFYSYIEAEEFVIKGFISESCEELRCYIPKELPLNFFVFKDSILKKKKEVEIEIIE